MHITGIYYFPSKKIGLKDNIFKLHLYKVYLTHPKWNTKIILSPKCQLEYEYEYIYI